MVQAIEAWSPNRKPAAHEFTSTDAKALRWYYNDAEAAFGISSTQGQIEDQLVRLAMGDDIKRETCREVRETLRAAERGDRPRLAAEIARTMHVKESRNAPLADPFNSDDVLTFIREERRIRKTLDDCSPAHGLLLGAAFGPSRGNEKSNRALRKHFGAELVEIVVGLVWMAHDDIGIAEAREIAETKSSRDASFVIMQSRQSKKMLDAAKESFGLATLTHGKAVLRWI